MGRMITRWEMMRTKYFIGAVLSALQGVDGRVILRHEAVHGVVPAACGVIVMAGVPEGRVPVLELIGVREVLLVEVTAEVLLATDKGFVAGVQVIPVRVHEVREVVMLRVMGVVPEA